MKKAKLEEMLEALSPEEKKVFYEKKLASYMGLASKAGKVASGTNTAIFTMAKGKAHLLIVCEDISDNGKDKVLTSARQNGVEYRVYGKAEDLGHYTGKYGAGVFCITDQNFADVIVKTIDNTSK